LGGFARDRVWPGKAKPELTRTYLQRVPGEPTQSRGGLPGENGVADSPLYTPVNDANIDNMKGSESSRIFYKFYAWSALTLFHKQYFLKAIGFGARAH